MDIFTNLIATTSKAVAIKFVMDIFTNLIATALDVVAIKFVNISITINHQ